MRWLLLVPVRRSSFDFRVPATVLRRFRIPVAQKFGARDYVTMRRYVSVSLKLFGGGDVGRGGHCHQSVLRIYPAFHAHTGEYL